MIELTPEQECQLRLPDRQAMIESTLAFLQKHLETIYRQRSADQNRALLGQGYDRATQFGISDETLIKKYMLYGLSAPALLDGEAVARYFATGTQSPNLLAQDLLAIIEMSPAEAAIPSTQGAH